MAVIRTKPEADPDALLPVAAFAELAGLSQVEAYRRIARGQIPHVRIGERGLRVPRKVLKDWIAEAMTGQMEP